ncbi:MAG: 5'-methylthioadenosine/adenosylhomocysteine nucleosidase [Oscillospiraceae bacterium]|nr:5'-methylthioadenosine/adenosylhomocysteine nucleosidase [Oscillospiraceae bacterium]
MKKIGIIGAMGSEIELLRARMENVTETIRAGRTFYSGKLGGTETVLVCSGIGKVNSAMTAQMLIDLFETDAIINTGVAGGAGAAKVRDVVVSTELTYHDMDQDILAQGWPNVKYFTADEKLRALAVKACEGRVTCHEGLIATGDQFIGSADVKADIVARLSPLAVEMEGGSIAHVCAGNGIPFVVIRCISDNADDGAEMSFETFVKLAADDAAEIVTSMLASAC